MKIAWEYYDEIRKMWKECWESRYGTSERENCGKCEFCRYTRDDTNFL